MLNTKSRRPRFYTTYMYMYVYVVKTSTKRQSKSGIYKREQLNSTMSFIHSDIYEK